MRKKFKIPRLFIYLIILFFLIFTVTACEQYKFDLEGWFEYWTCQVKVNEFSIDGYSKKDASHVFCIPSNSDQSITLTSENPHDFKFAMPDQKPEMIKFNLSSQPVYGTDYEMKQESRYKLKLTYKKAFLQRYEKTGKDIGPTMTLFDSESGRPFLAEFKFTVRVNTVIPDVNDNVVIAKYNDNGTYYYVLCIKVPNMNKKHKDIEGNDVLLHNDIKYLLINGTQHELTVNNEDTDFNAGGNFLKREQVEEYTNSIPITNGSTWVAYYKTDRRVDNANRSLKYTLELKDSAGLISDNKKESKTPVGKPQEIEVSFDTSEHTNRMILDDATSDVNTTSSTIDNPIKFHVINASDGEKALLKIKSPSEGTKIKYTVTNINTGEEIKNDITLLDSILDIELPAELGTRIKYKVGLQAIGDGTGEDYTDGDTRDLFYTIDYRYKLLYNQDINLTDVPNDPFKITGISDDGTITDIDKFPEYHYSGDDTIIGEAVTDGYEAMGWTYTYDPVYKKYTNPLSGDSGIDRKISADYAPNKSTIQLHPKWDATEVNFKVIRSEENTDDDEYSVTEDTHYKIESNTKFSEVISAKNLTNHPNENFETGNFEPASGTTINEKIDRHGHSVIKMKYNRKRVTVIIRSNGGNGVQASPSAKVKCGKEIYLGDPWRNDWNFDKWSKTGGSISGNYLTVPKNDVTVTAKWYRYKIKIVFGDIYTTVTHKVGLIEKS